MNRSLKLWILKPQSGKQVLEWERLTAARNSQGVETCNSHMFALSDAREYSFSKVPYLEREKITSQSNFVIYEM